MLGLQVKVLMAWQSAREQLLSRMSPRDDETGEVTATMAMIAILVIAAVAAAGVIAAQMGKHAAKVPDPK